MKESKKAKIVEMVRKLLALAKDNSNEHESIAAALKAQQLMVKYDIEENEVVGEQLEEIIHESIHVGNGKKWKYVLATLVSKNFRCKAYANGNQEIVFCGYTSDVKIAKEVYSYLFSTGNTLARAYVKKVKEQGYAVSGVFNSYISGYLNGIRESLEKQCRALMIVTPTEVEEEFKQYTSGFKSVRTRIQVSSRKAMDEGKADAKTVIDSRSISAKEQVGLVVN